MTVHELNSITKEVVSAHCEVLRMSSAFDVLLTYTGDRMDHYFIGSCCETKLISYQLVYKANNSWVSCETEVMLNSSHQALICGTC